MIILVHGQETVDVSDGYLVPQVDSAETARIGGSLMKLLWRAGHDLRFGDELNIHVPTIQQDFKAGSGRELPADMVIGKSIENTTDDDGVITKATATALGEISMGLKSQEDGSRLIGAVTLFLELELPTPTRIISSVTLEYLFRSNGNVVLEGDIEYYRKDSARSANFQPLQEKIAPKLEVLGLTEHLPVRLTHPFLHANFSEIPIGAGQILPLMDSSVLGI